MSTAAESTERDAQLLSIGKQCSAPSCHLVDYLPFKCQHCEQSFCGDHFKVEAHKCPKYDESKFDRVAPNCPLCNQPVAIPPNQDPNIRMEQHLTRDCSVMTGKSGKARSVPQCARAKCSKPLYAPIRCDQCKEQFCPQHRFPADHDCAPTPSPGNRLGSAPMKSLADLYSKTSSSTKKVGGALTSIKPSASSSIASAKTKQSADISVPKSSSPVTLKNPIATLKTDRAVSSAPSTTDTNSSNAPLAAGRAPNIFNDDGNDKPRIINPLAYIPRSIFASA